jgi:hypothetical protein
MILGPCTVALNRNTVQNVHYGVSARLEILTRALQSVHSFNHAYCWDTAETLTVWRAVFPFLAHAN